MRRNSLNNPKCIEMLVGEGLRLYGFDDREI